VHGRGGRRTGDTLRERTGGGRKRNHPDPHGVHLEQLNPDLESLCQSLKKVESISYLSDMYAIKYKDSRLLPPAWRSRWPTEFESLRCHL
jgi:hypothetical protein